MKIVKLRRFKVKKGYMLAAIVREGEKQQDVFDPRSQIILIEGKEIRELLAVFKEIKKRKIKLNVNYFATERLLLKAKKSNADSAHHSKKPPQAGL